MPADAEERLPFHFQGTKHNALDAFPPRTSLTFHLYEKKSFGVRNIDDWIKKECWREVYIEQFQIPRSQRSVGGALHK